MLDRLSLRTMGLDFTLRSPTTVRFFSHLVAFTLLVIVGLQIVSARRCGFIWSFRSR